MPNQLRTGAGPSPQPPYPFTIDGDVFELPALDTRTWVDVLVLEQPGCWWQLVPAKLDGDGYERLVARMLDPEDRFDLDDLEDIALGVLSTALGMELWAASRLAASVYGNWLVFDGWCFTRGLDPLSEPIGRLLSAAYAWRRGLCVKESEMQRLDSEIWAPATGLRASGNSWDPAPQGWSDEQEAAQFMAARAALGGR